MDVNINKGRGTRTGNPPRALAMDFVNRTTLVGR